MVEFLIQNFVDQNETDLLGLTAAEYAERGGHQKIVELLSAKESKLGTQPMNNFNGRIFSN